MFFSSLKNSLSGTTYDSSESEWFWSSLISIPVLGTLDFIFNAASIGSLNIGMNEALTATGSPLTEQFSEDPVDAIGQSVVFSSVMWSGWNTSEGEPLHAIIFWWDNAVPYTRLERKATDLYNAIKADGKAVNRKTAFVAETKSGYELLSSIMGSDNIGKQYDTLLALEKYLSDSENGTTH